MEQTKIKILCVEDEADIRENISDILRDEGFEVFEAENGKKGFEIFNEVKPDLIISDIMMPEVDGYGLLKLVRESQSSRRSNIPFIFLTALGQKESIVKGVNMSANDYLIKPIDFELMIAKIKEKTSNALKVQGEFKKGIKNIKDQFSSALPSDVNKYLDVISKTTQILKDESYGPLPHRKYLEDFDKISNNINKLRVAIENSFDENVIESKMNVYEEIIDVKSFLADFFGGLNQKYRDKIKIDDDVDDLPKIRCDRVVIYDAIKKILSGFFRADIQAKITIRVMIDHLDQMVLIFSAVSNKENLKLEMQINESIIGRILDQQNCRFEVVDNQSNTAILIIPSFRIIKK